MRYYLSRFIASTMILMSPIALVAQNGGSSIDNHLISGERVINTTKLTTNIFGYGGVTPIKLYIIDGKVDKVELLDNYESPDYLSMVISEGFLERWDGLSIDKVADHSVDCVSGATYTSNAIINNVKAAAKYATENK